MQLLLMYVHIMLVSFRQQTCGSFKVAVNISDTSTQLIVLMNTAKIKLFTLLNLRYAVNNPDNW